MLINDLNKKYQSVNDLIKDLLSYLEDNKERLFCLNKNITQDTDYWIEKDFVFINSYLKNYFRNNKKVISSYLKPKGKIFIILSYNEPFVLSIIPVINALVAGNEVILKPSQKNLEFVNELWVKSKIVSKYKLKLNILQNFNYDDLDSYVEKTKAVYFFGGYEKAKVIYQACSRYFVEFIPEIEAADCKIVNITEPNNFDINTDVRNTVDQAFSHAGQSCQRIHGVFVNKLIYENYLKELTKLFKESISSNYKNISENFKVNDKILDLALCDIKKAKAKNFFSDKNKQIPFLVVNPLASSNFIKNAYFLPIIWIIPFESNNEIINFLHDRKFYLGLNIIADNQLFIDEIVENTNFSRYTINSPHTDIRKFEGWGGNWPTGYKGYNGWLYHFSNPYIKIR